MTANDRPFTAIGLFSARTATMFQETKVRKMFTYESE